MTQTDVQPEESAEALPDPADQPEAVAAIDQKAAKKRKLKYWVSAAGAIVLVVSWTAMGLIAHFNAAEERPYIPQISASEVTPDGPFTTVEQTYLDTTMSIYYGMDMSELVAAGVDQNRLAAAAVAIIDQTDATCENDPTAPGVREEFVIGVTEAGLVTADEGNQMFDATIVYCEMV